MIDLTTELTAWLRSTDARTLMKEIVAEAMTPLMPGAGPPPTRIARVSMCYETPQISRAVSTTKRSFAH